MRSTEITGRAASPRLALVFPAPRGLAGRGAVPSGDGPAPWSTRRTREGRSDPPPRSLTMRWLVTHESTESRSKASWDGIPISSPDASVPAIRDSHTPARGAAGSGRPANRARVMWHSPQQFHGPAGANRRGRRIRTRPLWICEVGPGPAAASRDAAGGEPGPCGPADVGPAPLTRHGDPIGVVKLLRARGGCLGVIRIRAWKAAISPGELPNEHRSRNARADPGN